MTFYQKLQAAKGFIINLPGGGEGQILETHWSNEKCLVKVLKGSGYVFDIDGIDMHFISDGTDVVVFDLADLSKVNI